MAFKCFITLYKLTVDLTKPLFNPFTSQTDGYN